MSTSPASKAPRKPSPQQQIAYDWVRTATGHAVMVACAGAGKTSTIEGAVPLMLGSVFVGAFNKDIAVEIEGRLGQRPGLTVGTMHSAGYRALRAALGAVRLDDLKVRKIFRHNIGLSHPNDAAYYATFEKQVLELVGYAKQAGFGVFPQYSEATLGRQAHALGADEHWQELIDRFDVETFTDDGYTQAAGAYSRAGAGGHVSERDLSPNHAATIIMLARATLEYSNAAMRESVDFNDMIYGPLLLNLRFPQYDWVVIDELQDTNAVRREMAKRMLKPQTGRFFGVGDPRQAIYGFTGADSSAMDLIARELGAARLNLTVSFRCPQAVVAHAQQWVHHIEASPDAPAGTVRTAEFAELAALARPGDVVLCRYNRPLIEAVYGFIAAGVPARIAGRDVAEGLANLASRWKVTSLAALLDKLDAYEEREILKAEAKENAAKVTQIEDKVSCLRTIVGRVQAKDAKPADAIGAVLAEIDAIFGGPDDDRPVVTLSSIHKAKGREWLRVIWLLSPPNPRAKQDWEVEAEDNLNYVAATRSKDELILIELPPPPPKDQKKPRAAGPRRVKKGE